MSFVLISVGIFLTISALLPVLKYEIFPGGEVIKDNFLSPVGASYQPENKDLIHASDWFVGDAHLPEVNYQIKYYKISVPKLKIEDAVVEIAGDDLSKNLVHFKGTTIPGRAGNAVIFGHSTLPQLYNPKNYLTIFTQLPKLSKGDEIFVDYDGITYTFKVAQMVEVHPEDIQILEQRYDSAYLSLVTCVPPGTTLRRLVVRAKLVPQNT